MYLRFLYLIILVCSTPALLLAQCCSQSCSMTTGDGSGLLEKKHLEVMSFYKHSYSDKYLRGKEEYQFGTAGLALKNSYFDFMGLNIGYGITDHLMIEVQGGYFGNKTQNFANGAWLVGNGLSDISATLKMSVYRSKDTTVTIVASGGMKIPTGSYNDYTPEGIKLSRDVQSGTGSYAGTIGFSAGIRILKKHKINLSSEFDYIGINPEEYQPGYGNTNYISTFIKLFDGCSLMAMIKNENRTHDYYYDLIQKSTGYVKVTALPGLSYEFPREWMVSVIGDLPLYQYFNGLQFASQYAFSVSLKKTFELHRHTNESIEPVIN